jgi:hypothetical protein
MCYLVLQTSTEVSKKGDRGREAQLKGPGEKDKTLKMEGAAIEDLGIEDVKLEMASIRGRKGGGCVTATADSLTIEDVRSMKVGMDIADAAGPERRSAHLQLADAAAALWGGGCLSRKWTGRELTWKCARGHIWQAPYAVVADEYIWCEDCPDTGREERCRVIIESLLGHRFPPAGPAFLRAPGRKWPLRLDGYNEHLNLGFEHHGAQHYRFVRHFHETEEGYAKQQRRDRRKEELCEGNRTALVVIPYYVKDIARWIRRELTAMGYLPPRLTPEREPTPESARGPTPEGTPEPTPEGASERASERV